MLAILPILFFLLSVIVLLGRAPERPLRELFLWAAMLWGVATTVLTESLSYFDRLSTESLAIGWASLTLATAAVLVGGPRPADRPRLPDVRATPRLAIASMLIIVGVLMLTGLLALAGWPNTFDSALYHLSRVAHWIQNGSAAFYPTNILHQLFYPPWAEFATLQMIALGWDERAANLVQWFSMLSTLVGVSLIARRLGADVRGQALSALFCATIPMGILQASTTQNDLVTTFWVVCFVYSLLEWQADSASGWAAIRVGVTFGLALLTKGTAYIFAAPFVLLLVLTIRQHRPKDVVRAAVLAGVLALTLNIPQFYRNMEVFGTILGSEEGHTSSEISSGQNATSATFALPLIGKVNARSGLTNDELSLRVVASNLVRNIGQHLGTPDPAVNDSLLWGITKLHTWLGLDISDPRTTYGVRDGGSGFGIPAFPTPVEDRAGNPFHLLAIIAATLVVAFAPRFRRDPRLYLYTGALVGGFLVFSFLLKWQPGGSRLQLPLFVLWSPVVALVLERHARLAAATTAVFALTAAPFLARNTYHPLIGKDSVLRTSRADQYFVIFPSLEPEFISAADLLRSRQCTDVGLELEGFEYDVWALLPEVSAGRGRIEHVGVTNASAQLEARRPPFNPCGVVTLTGRPPQTMDVDGHQYHLATTSHYVQLFLRDETSQAVDEADTQPVLNLH